MKKPGTKLGKLVAVDNRENTFGEGYYNGVRSIESGVGRIESGVGSRESGEIRERLNRRISNKDY
jgi:hypothetical protein